MKTFNDFKSDLYNMIETAIMNGVSGSTIADTLVNNLHISRENALTMVVSVVAHEHQQTTHGHSISQTGESRLQDSGIRLLKP